MRIYKSKSIVLKQDSFILLVIFLACSLPPLFPSSLSLVLSHCFPSSLPPLSFSIDPSFLLFVASACFSHPGEHYLLKKQNSRNTLLFKCNSFQNFSLYMYRGRTLMDYLIACVCFPWQQETDLKRRCLYEFSNFTVYIFSNTICIVTHKYSEM